jgi:hypothetical protein
MTPPHAERQEIHCNPNSYIFAAHEYEEYLSTRQDALKGVGLAHALMQGGFMWRLAFEAYRDGHPSNSFERTTTMPFASQRYWCYHGTDAFTYDVPSAALEDTICGTYVLISSIKGVQSQVVSWYPHLDTYIDMCIDLGRWTPLAEEVFQTIHSGQSKPGAQPRSQGWWRHYFKRYHRTAKKILVTCRTTVREFLVDYAEEV